MVAAVVVAAILSEVRSPFLEKPVAEGLLRHQQQEHVRGEATADLVVRPVKWRHGSRGVSESNDVSVGSSQMILHLMVFREGAKWGGSRQDSGDSGENHEHE